MGTTSIVGVTTRDKLVAAKRAAAPMAQLSTAQKNALLLVMADAIEANADKVLAANRIDLETSGLAGAMRDRLLLNSGRIGAMAAGVREVAGLPDPVYQTLEEWT